MNPRTGNISRTDPATFLTLSAVVLCFNSEDYIEKCVRSIAVAAETLSLDYEIIIVENGSTDQSAHRLKRLESEKHDRVQVIPMPRNVGTTVSRNIAISLATGRYLLILDADATIGSTALETLIGTVESDKTVGIVAPRLVYPDGRKQLSVDKFPTVGRKLRRLFALRGLESELPEHPKPATVDYAISACWLLPRSTVELVGPLDERIFYSPEDADYCLRVWQSGLRVVYEPRVTAVHCGQELSRSAAGLLFFLRHVRGLAYYFRKHGYCFSAARVYERLPNRNGPANEEN